MGKLFQTADQADESAELAALGALTAASLAAALELETDDLDAVTGEFRWLFSAAAHLGRLCQGQVDAGQPIPVPIPATAHRTGPASNRLLATPANPSLFTDSLDHLNRVETRWHVKVARQLQSHLNRVKITQRRLKLQLEVVNRLGQTGAASGAWPETIRQDRLQLLDALRDLANLMNEAFGIYVTTPAQLHQLASRQ